MRAMRALVYTLAFLLLAAPAVADELDPLSQAIDQRPDDSKAYDAYAQAAFKAKRWDDAIRKLKIGVARIPDYPEGYYRLGYAFRQKKEWADAADYYRRYISINPAKTDPYFGLGISLEGMGDKRGASAAFAKYVSLEQSPAKQWFIDYAKSELGKLDSSRAPAVAAAPPVTTPAAQPTDPYRNAPPAAGPARSDAASLRAQADQARKEGRLEEAVTAYRRAIESDRGNLDLYNDLGNVYFSLKRFNEASSSFQSATDRDPNFALGWYNLAHALRKANRNPEAASAYKQYMRLRPDDPDPYYGLGQTLKATGDMAGAIDAFRKYISMEKRPDEQKWVDKAKAELEALEMMKRGPTGRRDSDLPKAMEAANQELDRELQRDAVLPMAASDDLIDPFKAQRGFGLRNPFPDGDGLIDPYSYSSGDAQRSPATVEPRRLRDYGAALIAYRRALSAQAEDVSMRYERGAALALMSDALAAARTWNTVRLDDALVIEAKKSVERARSLFARR